MRVERSLRLCSCSGMSELISFMLRVCSVFACPWFEPALCRCLLTLRSHPPMSELGSPFDAAVQHLNCSRVFFAVYAHSDAPCSDASLVYMSEVVLSFGAEPLFSFSPF